MMSPLDQAVNEFCEDVIARAQRNLGAFRSINGKRRRRVSSGKLKDSLIYFVARDRFKTVIDFTTKDEVDAYAGVIELGRRKGARQPPSSAILQWMDDKKIRLQKKGGGFIKETPALRKSVAFLIARSIKENGIEGIYYYRDAIRDAIENADELFLEALKKEIELRTTLR
jgi:hypothetical protein